MREDFLVMLDWQPHLVRAGVGMGEVIPRPSVELAARAAYRQSPGTASGSTRRANDYLVGQALDEAERSGEELQVVWPLQLAGESASTSAATANGAADMAVDGENGAAVGNVGSSTVDGVQDWPALEAIFRHILFTGLALPSKPVNHMVLLAIPSYLPPSAHGELARVFFEDLGIVNLMIVERAIAQLYSCASMSGVVADVGLQSTDIAVIYESQLHPASMLRCNIGEQDCDDYLVNLLLEHNADLPSVLTPPDESGQASSPLEGRELYNAVLQVVSILKDGEYIRHSTDKSAQTAALNVQGGRAIDGEAAAGDEEEEEGITDVAKALASGKVGKMLSGQAAQVTVLDGDKLEIQNPFSASLPAVTVGPERHRYAEPLLDPSVLAKCTRFPHSTSAAKAGSPSLPDTIAAAVATVPEVDARGVAWESVVFTGGLARVKGVASALVAHLHRYAADLPTPAENAAIQYSRRAKHAKTPDYFSEFRERPDMTSFLGASIYAKLGFLDTQGGEWMTKQDYNERGPSIATHMLQA